jgi:transcriptional regulator with GAF, ATPase, and Fis domain
VESEHIVRESLAPEDLELAPEDLENVIHYVRSPPRQPSPRTSDASPADPLSRETALWRSDKMQEVWEIIEQAANIDVTVLISGETGTGKDLVARAIHSLSSRQHAPYVAVNCAAVPKELLESELFGHERGAFTGAHQLKIGKFESANNGTIFLDEIGDLHPGLQAKLLHVLQDGTFSRIGGKLAMKADVRVLAATNRDLPHAVATARFRDDLYYRLNVIDIVVPPLRERPEEIPLLAAYFMERYSKLYHRKVFELSPDVMDRLKRYRYPGNVRELENIIKRLIILGTARLGNTTPPPESSAAQTSKPPHPGQPASVKAAPVEWHALRRHTHDVLQPLQLVVGNRLPALALEGARTKCIVAHPQQGLHGQGVGPRKLADLRHRPGGRRRRRILKGHDRSIHPGHRSRNSRDHAEPMSTRLTNDVLPWQRPRAMTVILGTFR